MGSGQLRILLLRNQRTFLKLNNPPLPAKDRVFFVLLGGAVKRAQENAQSPMGRLRMLTAIFEEHIDFSKVSYF